MLNKRYRSAFTIVELLIVIVVITILAVISIVSYNGIQNKAANASRQVELKQWSTLFRTYHTLNESYPTPPGYGNYCLGKNFYTKTEIDNHSGPGDSVPGSGVGNPDGYCRDIRSNGSRHEVSKSINEQLETIGNLPGSSLHKKTIHYSVGPFVTYQESGVYITGIFKGTSCPSDLEPGYVYPHGSAIMCLIRLP